MTEDRVEQFLKSEEEASLLVDELSKLREETDAYKAAQGALDGAAQDLGGLIDRVAIAADGVKDVSATLREIGTPALLAGQEELSEQMRTARDEVRAMKLSLLVSLPLIVLLGTAGLVLALL